MGANGSSLDSKERIQIGPYSIKKKKLLGEGRYAVTSFILFLPGILWTLLFQGMDMFGSRKMT
jgi:hypothetical protein